MYCLGHDTNKSISISICWYQLSMSTLILAVQTMMIFERHAHLLGSGGVNAGYDSTNVLHLLPVKGDDAHGDWGAWRGRLCHTAFPPLQKQGSSQLCLSLQGDGR